ncbi:MAG TPA: DUF1592 domain-containing protein [Polyangia bacterium]|nr:DUF1592 domain-containing protein [Polyangia bacterium]
MKAGNESKVSLHLTLACSAALALATVACNGAISGEGQPGGGPGAAGSGSGIGGPSGTAGGAMMNPPPATGGSTGTGGAGVVGPLDSGRVSIHRLNNLEYDNTVMTLLGVNGMAQATFQPDEQGEFDNDADAFTMNDARYEQYFNNADTIGETVFADTAATGLRQTYVYGLVTPPCTLSATDTGCSSKIIAAFGAKAWRRPLTTAEVMGLQTLATNAISLGETADGSIKQVVKTLLASPQFLYRIEFDPNPTSTVAHSLDPYELATRMSYLGWSNMPDQALFDLAASGQILQDAVLTQQVDRMLADPKGANFTNSFAGQWLGARDMQAHQVEPTAFMNFDDALRSAFIQEELLYFNQFLTGPPGGGPALPMTKFFTTNTNFVNTRLAQHYGFGNPTGTAFQMVTGGSPNRIGFMGLGSFLTFTSYSYRTAPTLRGKWILLNLLCQTIPSPPANVPKLDATAAPTDASAQQENVRAKLTAHRQAADCFTCHSLLDPIGLGLENFDAIGKYRTSYSAGGPPIDASGMLPSGEMFSSLSQLATILSMGTHGQQLTDCASHKMMTYALSRSLVDSDNPYLNQVRTTWAGQGYGLKDLMKDIVTNDTFKFRRGEAP